MFFKKGKNYSLKIDESPKGYKIVDGFVNTSNTKITIQNCTFTGNSKIIDIPFDPEQVPYDEEVTITEESEEEKYWKELAYIKQKIATAPDESQETYWTNIYNRIVEDHQNKVGRTK